MKISSEKKKKKDYKQLEVIQRYNMYNGIEPPLINMENGREDSCLRTKHGHIYWQRKDRRCQRNIVVCNKRKEREKEAVNIE